MKHETPVYYTCGQCAVGTGPLDLVDDVELPAGWLQIVVSRIVPNPGYRGPAEFLDELVKGTLASLPPGAIPSPAEIEALRATLRPQADMHANVAALADEQPPYIIEEAELAICHECAGGAIEVLAKLDSEAMDGFDEEDEVVVEPGTPAAGIGYDFSAKESEPAPEPPSPPAEEPPPDEPTQEDEPSPPSAEEPGEEEPHVAT